MDSAPFYIYLVEYYRLACFCRFINGVYKSLYVPLRLVKDIAVKGIPLIINEVMWAAGLAVISYSYSLRGLDVVAALNINSTIINLFNVVYLSLGS